MNRHSIAVIPGDGVGPEVMDACLMVLDALDAPFDYQRFEAGDAYKERTGQAMPQKTMDGARAADAVLFGAAGNTAVDVILPLRRNLGTFVNLRPSRAPQGIKCLYPGLDLVIVRENTECLYLGAETRLTDDAAIATRLITKTASERIARWAFDFARAQGRPKVTAVHKANVLPVSDGLFLECCRAVAPDYQDIEYDEAIVDACAMKLALNPRQFSVLVTTNMFGDILSDLAAGLIGGLGLCPSANLGEHSALFEPVHGSAPDIAGTGQADPAAMIMCGSMLLAHLGYQDKAAALDAALDGAIAAGETTPDLGGSLNTGEMAQAVAARLA